MGIGSSSHDDAAQTKNYKSKDNDTNKDVNTQY